jgi:hypothetical protein
MRTGQAEAYSGQFTAQFNPLQSGGANPLQLTFTPQLDCWWEIIASIGLAACDTAAYSLAYGQVILSPVDADGKQGCNYGVTQHSAVNQFEGRSMSRLYKLVAGTAYTVNLAFSPSSGTWRYYCGPDYLSIQGKAWPR